MDYQPSSDPHRLDYIVDEPKLMPEESSLTPFDGDGIGPLDGGEYHATGPGRRTMASSNDLHHASCRSPGPANAYMPADHHLLATHFQEPISLFDQSNHFLQQQRQHSPSNLQTPPTVPPSGFQGDGDWAFPGIDLGAVSSMQFVSRPDICTNIAFNTDTIDFGLPGLDTNFQLGNIDTFSPNETNPGLSTDFQLNLPTWESTLQESMARNLGAHIAGPETTRFAGGVSYPTSRHAVYSPHEDHPRQKEEPMQVGRNVEQRGIRPGHSSKTKPKQKKHRAASTASNTTFTGSTKSDLDPQLMSSTADSNTPELKDQRHSNNKPKSSQSHTSRGKGRARSITTTTTSVSSTSAGGPTPTSTISAASFPPDPTNPTPRALSVSSTSASARKTSEPRLRSASRASKNVIRRPSETVEDRRARASHNLVEKQYRSRLNAQFEGLLKALPDTGVQGITGDGTCSKEGAAEEVAERCDEQDQGERRVSKAEVLERARLHIETLEQEQERLKSERKQLLEHLYGLENDEVTTPRSAT